ncbi:MAG: hypothetical protein ACKVWV_05595 [Planctomycetota bacterium]
MTRQRMVALCDILGFKRLIESRPLDKLLAHDLALFRRLTGYSVKQGLFPTDVPRLDELRAQERVGVAWFSDTLLLYARDDDELSRRNVLETVGWLLFMTTKTKTPLRIGIDHGEFHASPEDEVFVGRALVGAYELERSQEWIGGALTANAAAQVPPRTTTGARSQWWVCEYSVPMKNGKTFDTLAIDWTQTIHTSFELRWSKERANPTEEERLREGSAWAKWENARSFHDSICVQCFPTNRERDRLKIF